MSSVDTPLVAIILLNWRGAEDTLECLQSLEKLSYTNKRIIIVDNASGADEVNTLRDACGPTIDLIENSNNEGYAKGNNIGISFATNTYHPDYYWLLNNDTVVDPRALTELVRQTRSQPRADIVGSRIHYYQSSRIYCLGGGVMNLWTGVDRLVGRKKVIYKTETPKRLSYVSGCSLFISHEAVTSVKGFDEDYFLYSEEVDLCFRAQQKGYLLGYADSSKVWHKSAQSTGHLSQTYVYYFLRNKLVFLKKNGRWWHYPSYVITFLCYYCLGFILLTSKNKRRPPVGLILRAIRDAFTGKWGKRDTQSQKV